jgi:hypothetical protein
VLHQRTPSSRRGAPALYRLRFAIWGGLPTSPWRPASPAAASLAGGGAAPPYIRVVEPVSEIF